MELNQEGLSKLAAAIRVISAEEVEKAKSGHPGLPLGAADFMAVLWAYYLRINAKDTKWVARDRFVLSAGHGSAMLYALLHLFGFKVTIDDLKNFRQLGSKTPGHPEFGVTDGVEVSTGPLGQGVANAVGLAISAKKIAACYGKQLAGRVFCVCGDGDLMEGISYEACSLAGHLQLNNLVLIYDDNDISIGGSTDITFTEDVAKRFEAQGWSVLHADGHNYAEFAASLDAAIAADKPCIVITKTTIGKGAPNKAGSAGVHGAPLGEDELKLLKQGLNWSEEPFYIPDDVYQFCNERIADKTKIYEMWQEGYKAWKEEQPVLAREFEDRRTVPESLFSDLVDKIGTLPADATRSISGKALQIIAAALPSFIGGSADLEPSNKTYLKDYPDLTAPDYLGRNIRYGVREHTMGAISNGLAYTKQWIPFCSTFAVFADYMRPAIRMAALAKLQTLFILTHDSFYVGEDGPTHQPIEQLASLRLIPNLNIYRPADGLETAYCYWQALQSKDTPSVLLFTRQKLPVLERGATFDRANMLRGGYIVSGDANPSLVIMASGSEVSLAVSAAANLKEKGYKVRVVSIPCLEIFKKQDREYLESVIPPYVKKVSIEAGSTMCWKELADLTIGIDHFGNSGPAEVLAKAYGFTAEDVTEKILNWLK